VALGCAKVDKALSKEARHFNNQYSGIKDTGCYSPRPWGWV